MITNCPNCGAPIKGFKCEYCDTVFIDPFYQRYLEDRLEEAKRELRRAELVMSNAELTNYILSAMNSWTAYSPVADSMDKTILYANNEPIAIMGTSGNTNTLIDFRRAL